MKETTTKTKKKPTTKKVSTNKVVEPKSKYDIETVCKQMEEYTMSSEIPILKEFAFNHNLDYNYLVQLRDRTAEKGDNSLSKSISRMLCKKEFMLEKLAMREQINVSFAVFSLKQLGWREKQELELGANTINKLKINLVAAE